MCDWSGIIKTPTPTPPLRIPHSHTTISTPTPDFHSVSRAPLPGNTPHSVGRRSIVAHSVSHYYPHQSQEREGDTAWCHSKLGPASTPSPAGEEQFSRRFLACDDEVFPGTLEARGLERSRRPRRHKLGPVSPVFPEAAGRVKRQRGARRRRATLSLSNGGGSSLHSIEIPGTLSSSWVLKIEHPRELQLVPYPLALCRRVESAAGGVGSNKFWNRIHHHA